MDIRAVIDEGLLEVPKYRCCPQNCHYFEFCVIQEGVKRVTCKQVRSVCEWYERITGQWIDTLQKFKQAFIEAGKEGVVLDKPLYKHRCEYCGKVFEGKTPERRFCSRKCIEAQKRKNKGEGKGEKKIKRICVTCGKAFWQTKRLSRVQKCCSLKCCGKRGNIELNKKRVKGKSKVGKRND